MSDVSLEQFVADHEVLWSMLSSAVMWGAGDIVAQRVERFVAKRAKNASTTTSSSSGTTPTSPPSSSGGSFLSWYDPLRTIRLAFYACCCWAPATFYWFQLLEWLFPGAGVVVAVKRMLLDQSLYAPAVIASLFVVVSTLEGRSWHAVVRRLKDGFLSTLLTNWTLWPLAQLLLQSGVIPRESRIAVANCINLPWTAFLAYKAAQQQSAGGAAASHHVKLARDSAEVGRREGDLPLDVDLDDDESAAELMP